MPCQKEKNREFSCTVTLILDLWFGVFVSWLIKLSGSYSWLHRNYHRIQLDDSVTLKDTGFRPKICKQPLTKGSEHSIITMVFPDDIRGYFMWKTSDFVPHSKDYM